MKIFGFAKAVQVERLIELVNKQQETISLLSSRLGFVVNALERTQKNFQKAVQEIDNIKQKGDFGLYYDFPINTLAMSEVEEEDKQAGRPTRVFREP